MLQTLKISRIRKSLKRQDLVKKAMKKRLMLKQNLIRMKRYRNTNTCLLKRTEAAERTTR